MRSEINACRLLFGDTDIGRLFHQQQKRFSAFMKAEIIKNLVYWGHMWDIAYLRELKKI